MDPIVRPNGHMSATKDRQSKWKWTVMIYLAGDNNLTANCVTVLQQLEAVKYKNQDVRVLACFDSNTPWPKGSRYLAINGKWSENNNLLDWELYNDLIITKARKHEITAPDFCIQANEEGRRSPMTRTEVNEGLRRFLHWAMKRHSKSDRYMLILYGHGPVVAGKTFLARENPPSSLPMKDIPELLKPHFGGRKRKLDILALQNCAMNGIETAYEVKDQVDYMIGSQGLVLASGWPYEKIISKLVDDPDAAPLDISERVLKVCARHLLDFAVMDRSSEQSVCDVNKLGNEENLTEAIKALSVELQSALTFKPADQRRELPPNEQVLTHPILCDAMRVARLEAQSYWGETFVDVYDFCERLMKKCNEAVLAHHELISSLGVDGNLESRICETDLVSRAWKISDCCERVIRMVNEMVPYSYYIGAELQYSRGLSIYFPWSMPAQPYSFAVKGKEHVLKTAFDTYSEYEFVKASKWADFLRAFYRATLRKVRRADCDYSSRPINEFSLGLFKATFRQRTEVLTTEFLQKTDSDTGGVDYEVWSNVKNYPRRNYLSPSDCARKIQVTGSHGIGSQLYPSANSQPVSYLGWNVCELVANVIKKPIGDNGDHSSSTKKEVTPETKAVAGI